MACAQNPGTYLGAKYRRIATRRGPQKSNARLARQILDLDRQVEDTTKLITERFRAHPQAAITESMPGMGPVLGAEFLVATGGSLTAFATSGRLAAYAGLVPVPRNSGRVTGKLRRQRYYRRLRRVFYMAALSSVKSDGPSRTFYQRKRSERLAHTQALLALARRLVDVLRALLRDARLFTASVSTAPLPAGAGQVRPDRLHEAGVGVAGDQHDAGQAVGDQVGEEHAPGFPGLAGGDLDPGHLAVPVGVDTGRDQHDGADDRPCSRTFIVSAPAATNVNGPACPSGRCGTRSPARPGPRPSARPATSTAT
jgi:Transposase IS116/IS110/IS902 family